MLKDGVNEIRIKNYEELVKIICGRSKEYKEDLREKFIFRGLSNIEYKLISSSLRKNKSNQLEINEFIESDKEFRIYIDKNEAAKNNLKYYESEDEKDKVIISLDKYGNHVLNKNSNYKIQNNKLQIERETYILLKFFDYADKSGLKVNNEGFSRILLHHNSYEPYTDYFFGSGNYEIISLAQHYGLPTRAMDWSYDYKVSLYFAVKDVLSNNTNDGVLWAFNYKLLENNKPQNKDFFTNLFVYRPEYNINPNLTAQKGVFTFLEIYTENYEKPLDEIISLELNQKPENRPFNQDDRIKITTIPTNITKKDTIFYKFIIPKEIKYEILKELYLEGYSEENLFPGYNGVTKSIINRVKLKSMSKKPHITKKNILLSVEWDIKKIKNKKIKYEFEKTPLNENIDKIFICKNNEVFGYFKRNVIIKDFPQKLWEEYGKFSEFSHEKFKNYFKDKEYGFAINTTNLKIFDYPITICNFKLENNFYVIEDDYELKFLLNFK